MVKYLHVSPLGIGVFDENCKIIELNSITDEELSDYISGKVLNKLKNLENKYPDVVIIDSSSDKNIIKKILMELKNQKKFELFRSTNMKLTAEKLSSLSMHDFMISQAINSIDETEKIINTLSTRLREWYSLYNPELSQEIFDHRKYSEAILNDVRKENSVGGKMASKNLVPIKSLAKTVNSMFKFIDEQESYLVELMNEYCPNLSAVATEIIGARLIELSGSLRRLSLYPSGTIQTLGAEKAMFRHLKSGDRPPKFGIVVLHPLVNKQKKQDKGKTARALASKISIAAKVDFFGGDDYEGYKLKEELDKNYDNKTHSGKKDNKKNSKK